MEYPKEFKAGQNTHRGIITDFGVFDMETNRWKDDEDTYIEPFLITYYDATYPEGVFFDKGSSSDIIFDFLRFYIKGRHRQSPFVAFAHNAGKFDLLPIMECAIREGQRFADVLSFKGDEIHNFMKFLNPIIPPDGSIISLTMRTNMTDKGKTRNSHKYVFYDSLRLLPGTLRALSQSFDVEHQKWSKQDVDSLGSFTDDKKRWRSYCLQDCKALYEVIERFQGIIHDMGGDMYNTIAKTATLGVFQKRYLTHDLPSYFKIENLIHNYYRGGRTEVFTMMAPPNPELYKYYDFNSLYPAMMEKYMFPYGEPRPLSDIKLRDFEDRIGFADATVVVPEDTYLPLLAATVKKNKKMVFPVGKIDGLFEGSLLLEADKLGYDVRLNKGWLFPEQDYLFRDFIRDLYHRRQEARTGAMNKTMKLLMNSSYGKFAQKSTWSNLSTQTPSADELLNGSVRLDFQLPHFGIYSRESQSFKDFMQPALSARVTALGRLTMHRTMMEVVRKGGMLFYCDTDSIITDTRLPSGKGLGELDLEREFLEGAFLSPKSYSLHEVYENGKKVDDVLKMKGFPPLLRDDFSYGDFVSAISNREYSFFKGSLFRPRPFKTLFHQQLGAFRFMSQELKKSVQNEYDKRCIDFSHPLRTTRPWKLSELEKV